MSARSRWVVVGLGGVLAFGTAQARPVKAGAGRYHLVPQGKDPSAPPASMRTEAMLKTAAQTSQWYSTLLFDKTPVPIYAQPVTVKTTPPGWSSRCR